MSLDLQMTRVKRLVKLSAPNFTFNRDALRAIIFVAQRISAHALQAAIAEGRKNKKKTIGYEHLAEAILRTPGLAFLRDTVPPPIQLNRNG